MAENNLEDIKTVIGFDDDGNDDSGFKPLSQMTKEELELEKTKGSDDSASDTNDPDNGGASGKPSGDGSDNNDDKKITFSEEVLKEIETLEGEDLTKQADTLLEKDAASLTEKELAILDKAGYDVNTIKSTDDNSNNTKSVFAQAAIDLGLDIEDEEAINALDITKKEDLISFTENVAEVKAEEILSEVLSRSKVLENVYRLVQSGAEDKKILEAVSKQLSGETISLSDDMKSEDKASVMKQLLEGKGISSKMAERLVNTAIEEETLDDEVKELYEEYKDKNKDVLEKEALAQEQVKEASIKEQQEKITKYWGDVNQTIQKGKLAGLTIPSNEMKSFYEWLSVPVDKKSNQSQSLIQYTQLPLENRLALDYIRYKLGDKPIDLSKLVDNVSRTKSVRDIIKKKEDTSASKKSGASEKVGGVSNLKGIKSPII